ncbi:MAG: hypothetical protein HYU59_10580 [Magnetospirillum gryphiswaldense]|nr:hypothetical protein [Magnetospirillum gryphiswaldense]
MGWLIIEDLKKAALATALALTLATLIAAVIPGARADQDSLYQGGEQASRP